MAKYKNSEKYRPYRSKLEWTCARLLEEHGIEYRYEIRRMAIWCPRPGGTSSYVFKRGKLITEKPHRCVTYLPDFSDPEGNLWTIEIKGFKTADFRIKWKLLAESKIFEHMYLMSNIKELKLVIEHIKSYVGNINERED